MLNDTFLRLFPKLVGAMVCFIFTMLLIVIHDTFKYDPPFETFNDSAEIISYPDYTVFMYKRELSIAYDVYGNVDRFIIHSPSGKTIQMEPSGQIYKKATRRPVYREFRMPKNMERGEWCLYAYLKYKPGWSWKEHVFEAPKVCASVN